MTIEALKLTLHCCYEYGQSCEYDIKTESNKEKILEIAAIKYFIVLLFFLERVKFLDWSSYLMKRS